MTTKIEIPVDEAGIGRGMFQIEQRVPVRMLLDTSASMAAVSPSKFEFARKLAAALCYVALVRLDSVTVHPFASALERKFVAFGGRHRFSPVMNYLASLIAQGPSDAHEVIRQFISLHPQRGLLIVISDFLDERGCEQPLKYLADFGHELLLVHVWADEDRTPPWAGELELRDAETGERLKIQVDEAARERYTSNFDQYAAGLRKLALRNSGRYVGLPASMPLEDAIFGPLIRAQSIA